ncbi:MAG: hypothetical protein C4522_14030 [Desulfobacteraceae bacterium]|nr:MAG: hypothetical protein C4522_14030 [Desulfobacteraceae bacterium]
MQNNMNMLKLGLILVVIGMVVSPCAGTAAMKALTNDSLHSVQGDSRISGNKNQPAAGHPSPIRKDGTVDGAPLEDELELFDTVVREFEQSHEYTRFSLLIQKLEAIASGQRHRQWLESAEGFALCFSMASAARKCGQHLSMLEETIENDGLKRLLETRRNALSIAVSFYDSLCGYRQGNSPLPDPLMLVSDIKSGQSAFEAEYAGFKTENR